MQPLIMMDQMKTLIKGKMLLHKRACMGVNIMFNLVISSII